MKPCPTGRSGASARRSKDKPSPAAKTRGNPSPRTWKRAFSKYTSFLSHTRTAAKKTLRNLILYPVALVCLYPLIIFRHNIYLIVLYLFIWVNIVLAVAVFLDELLDLPRKR